jgi:hypothetical protein
MRGINLAGFDTWLDDRLTGVIRDAGFDLVRLPVVWPTPFEVVDRAVGLALDHDPRLLMTPR